MSRRWLVKTEPTDYAYADLARDRRTTWDGIANALALKHLRAMETGDLVLVYHTGRQKAVAGLARVAQGPRPDGAAGDARRVVVDLEAVATAKTPMPLAALRAEPRCAGLDLLRLPRLSVMPVPDAAWEAIAQGAGLPARP